MKDHTKFDGRAQARMRGLRRAFLFAQPNLQRRPGARQLIALLRAGEQGQSLVEFALLLPVLMLLTTGIFVFGVAMNNYMELTNAVSVAARTVAINAGITTDPCATASTAVINAAPGLSSSGMTFSVTFVSASVTAPGTSCKSDAADLTSGSTVQVTATYPLNLSIYGKVFNLNNAVLEASSTELVQ
jgi:Flp pilus assembly protein TadG